MTFFGATTLKICFALVGLSYSLKHVNIIIYVRSEQNLNELLIAPIMVLLLSSFRTFVNSSGNNYFSATRCLTCHNLFLLGCSFFIIFDNGLTALNMDMQSPILTCDAFVEAWVLTSTFISFQSCFIGFGYGEMKSKIDLDCFVGVRYFFLIILLIGCCYFLKFNITILNRHIKSKTKMRRNCRLNFVVSTL